MSKHTPGPWQYAFEGGTTAFITEADGSTIICIRTTENTTAHKNLASNVCLIAAAPDLLRALKDFSDYVRNEQNSTDGAVTYSNTQINRLVFYARDAIAKAEAV